MLRFRRCCGVAVEAGGGIKRRCGPNGSSKQCCYLPQQRRSSRFLAVFFVFYVPSRFLALLPLGVGFSVSLSSVSVDFLSSSLSSVFSFFGSPLFLSSSSSVFLGLFIEPRGGAFYGCTWGGQGLRRLVGHSGAAVETLLPCFLHGARRVVGQRAWLARCGSLGFLARHAVKREAAHLKKKNPPFCFLPLLHVHGRKKEEQCRSKRHRSDLLLLFFFLA